MIGQGASHRFYASARQDQATHTNIKETQKPPHVALFHHIQSTEAELESQSKYGCVYIEYQVGPSHAYSACRTDDYCAWVDILDTGNKSYQLRL